MKNKTNCPNCGAPIKYIYNHNCEYCGTFLAVSDNKKYVENKSLCDIKVDCNKMYAEYCMLFTVTGVLVDNFKRCYQNVGAIYCIDEFLSPQKIGFSFKIPICDFYKMDIRELLANTEKKIPPEFKRETAKILRKIYEVSRKIRLEF